jgi:integrase
MSSPSTRRLEKTSEPGVFKRGNRFVFVYRDVDGRQRKKAAGETIAEARVVKAQTLAGRANGDSATASKELFRDYARRWVDSCPGRTKRGLREQTRNDYRENLERDAIPYLGRLRLVEIRPSHLDGLAERIAARKGPKGDPVTANTVRLALAPVRALFADALQRGDITRNPTLGWKTRHTQTLEEIGEDEDGSAIDEQVKALSEEQLATLLGKLPDDWQLFFTFLAQTGLRISEATELRWRDVDLGQKRFKVRRRFYRGTVAPPKTKHGRRTLRLSDDTARALWRIRRGEDELVFTTSTGKRINAQNLQRRVLSPAAEAAGVAWLTFHGFRHTCASVLFRAGWNAKQVQRWLGHHSPAFTLAVYVHLLDDDLPDPSFLDAIGGGSGADGATPERDRGSDAGDGDEHGDRVLPARSAMVLTHGEDASPARMDLLGLESGVEPDGDGESGGSYEERAEEAHGRMIAELSDGGNRGATTPTETRRNHEAADVPETAENLAAVRAV